MRRVGERGKVMPSESKCIINLKSNPVFYFIRMKKHNYDRNKGIKKAKVEM